MGWRSIIGLIVGVVAGCAVIFGLEMVGHAFFQIRDDTPMAAVPTSMKLAVVAIYAVASFVGGAFAARVGRISLPSFGVGGTLLGMGILSATMVHQPTWMVVANCAALALPAILAGWMFARPLPPPAPPAQHELPLSH